MSPQSKTGNPLLSDASRLYASDALHHRVSRFALGERRDTFEALARDVARFQWEAVLATRPLWGLGPFATQPDSALSLSAIPALPVEAMRHAPVFAFDAGTASHTFETSGTTSAETGRHHGRRSDTYATLLREGAHALLHPGMTRALVLALLPEPSIPTRSSLTFMAQRLMETLDGRSLDAARDPATFSVTDSGRWLLARAGVDVARLRHGLALATRLGEPVLLITTSFALLDLLDQLGDEVLPLPPGSVVMPTGGFKGRTREVDPEWLRGRTERLLAPHAVVHEYGMTELSSQLYERTHPALERRGDVGLYFESPTVRVIAVDPVTLEPVPDGEVGLATFVDLGNVDSALRILTQDLVVREGEGVRLLGREKRAPSRGCSLLAESLARPRVVPAERPVSVALPGSTAAPPEATNAALERVLSLLGAARRLRDGTTKEGRELRAALVGAGTLSREGIEAALENCLESDPSETELRSLVGSVTPAARVWICASANVFVAAHRAIALGLAASPEVFVKPSRREPLLTRALAELTPGLFRVVERIEPVPDDHVHAYGSDATLTLIRDGLPNGVRFYGHGDGVGLAWLASGDVDSAARGFALDAALFDQRGCASLRVIVVSEAVDVSALAAALIRELDALGETMPLGRLDAQERAALTRFRALSAVVAERVFDCASGVLAVQQDPERVLLPPVGRNLVLVHGPRALARVAEAAPLVTTVAVQGSASDRAQARQLFPHARLTVPGRMQRPPFDGPLDRRPC